MRIAHEIIERTDHPEGLYLVAIPNGGVPLARRLAANLRQIADLEVPVGVLDTTLYRDDLMSTGERPVLRRTEMPSAVDDHVVILVDDVVKTGRTIRAAMDALMDFGRPRVVQVVGDRAWFRWWGSSIADIASFPSSSTTSARTCRPDRARKSTCAA
jgi:pyrimidine operon attenuation protein/uracil phosphoribosyltransferase